eukprot:scaffold87785_cov59-Phaeocystis_antarctica.AAC.3
MQAAALRTRPTRLPVPLLLAYCNCGTLRDPAIPIPERPHDPQRSRPGDPRDPFRSDTWSGLSLLVCASQIGDVSPKSF